MYVLVVVLMFGESTEEKMIKEINSAYEQQQELSKILLNKCYNEETDRLIFDSVKKLCQKHAELIQDFRSVKEINKVMSFRFDDVLKLLPTPMELDLSIVNLISLYKGEALDKTFNNRFKTLMSFRKVLVAVHQKEDKIRPKSYEESVETKEVE